jgi:glutathione S-transferase
MAIKLAKITCELREVFLNNKPEHMIAISNKGTVPVLVLPDGKVIDESLDVMLWALKHSDPEDWLQDNNTETITLINEYDFEFTVHLDHYKYHVRYPEKSQYYYRTCAEEFINKLEKRLQQFHGQGLMTERITLADVAIFPFIRQFAHVDWPWFSQSKYINLKHWLEIFNTSSLFKSVMDKYNPWDNNKNIILFG